MATTYEMGFINVPISPTFVGIAGKLNDQLIKPARDAGKKAATEVEKSVEASVKGLERQVAASTKKLGDLDRAYQDSVSKREAQQSKLNAAIAEQAAAEDKYQQALKKGDSGLAELAKVEKAKAKVTDETLKLTKAERDITDAEQKHKAQLEDLHRTTAKYEQAQNEAGKSTQSLRDRLIEMNAEAESAGGIFDGLGGKIGGALKGLAIGGVAATGAAAAGLVKLGTDFDDAFDTIRIGTGASGEAFDDLVASAKSIANEIPAMDGGFGQISSTLADLNTRLGLTGEPLETMTSQFVQLSNMGIDADINEISAAMSQFGVETDAMPDMMDSLFQISQATGRSMTELTSSLSKSGPALQEFGFGLEESAGLLGQLDKAGLNSEQMMGAMTKALQGFADSGKEPQEALWGTISSIEELQAAGKDMEALDLANSVFGPKGGAQFVQAIGDGQFAWDDFMGSIGATEDTILGIADETADFAESWQLLKQKAMDALQPIASALFDQLAPALDQASTWIFESLVPAMSELWEQIQPLVEQGFNVLSEVLGDIWRVIADDLVPAFQEFGEWLRDNRDWLEAAGVAAGILAGGLVLMNTQQKIATAGGFLKWMQSWTVMTELQTAAQRILNTVMRANKIGLIITAVAALVAGLTYFFTKTELGQEIWGKFTTALGDAWDWVVGKLGEGWAWIQENVWEPFMSFLTDTLLPIWESIWGGIQAGWENIIKPVFDGIWTVAKVTLGVIATLILAPLLIAWNLLSAGIAWAWENLIKPAWDAISTFATETLWPILQSAFEWIGEKWSQMSELFGVVWEWLRDNVFLPLSAFVTETLWPALQNAFQWIGDKWQWLSDTFSEVWSWIDQNVFTPFNFAVDYLRAWFEMQIVKVQWYWDAFKFYLQLGWMWIDENVFGPLRGGVQRVADWFNEKIEQIKGIWQGWQDKLHSVWVWVDENVFANIGAGLDTVKGWFQTGVDGIVSIWDGLKKKLADPINWVISFVYTDGIKRVFDGVAEKVGLDARLPDVPTIAFADGGMMPGYTPGRDVHTFYSPTAGILELSGGEPVLRPEAGKVLGKEWVDSINYVARTQGERGVEKYLTTSHFSTGGFYGGHQALASGGFTNLAGGLSAIQQSHGDFVGRFFPDMFNLTSAMRFTDTGHHSTGKATDWQAKDGHFQTQMPTTWSKALANAIYTNFGNSAELIHWPLDGWQNLTNGSPHDFGPGTNADHGNHVHWATHNALRWEDGNIVLDDVPGAGGSRFNPLNWFEGLSDRILGAIPTFDMDGFGAWGEVPGAALETLGSFVKDWALEKLTAFGDTIKGWFGSGSVESYRPLVESILREKGLPESLADNTLRRMNQESTGDPAAQNNWDSNALAGWPTKGLMQMRDDTFASHADPGYNDIWDPESNIRSSINYALATYGSLPSAYDRAGGYALGGIIDLPELFTRDLGGIVPSGALVRNTSGRDEMMLPPETTALLNRFFAEFPEVAAALESSVVALEGAAEWLAAAADSTSVEGITARQSARRFLDLGLDIPGLGIVEGLLDSEEDLLTSRARHLGHLDNLVEKEKAFADAREALAKLESSEDKLSTQDQRKLDDAQKAVDEAKANLAKADPEEKRAAATEKLADAEEKLTRVREDLDENATKNAEKHAEEITKANEQVAKAEADLIEAKKQQVMDLDHLVLVSQDSIMGLVPQAESLANQLLGMGAPVGMVSQGLGSVIGALTSVAGMAGPAGITLGMAFDAVKIGIQLVETIVGVIEEIIETIHAARMAALQAMADGWRIVAEYASLVVEMQANVSSLQQEIVRGLNEQRTAEFALRVAQQDRLIAEAESAVAVAEARLALDREIERGNIAAQLRLMGLHEDWDSYLSFQALASQGMLDHWSDTAIGALFTYEAARAKALQAELTARVDQINAEAQLAAATRQNLRNQADLLKAQERLILMSAEVAGVDLVEATATAQVADIVVQMAELQKQMDSNLLGKAGSWLGTSGPWSNEYRGQQKQMDMFRDTLDVLFKEYGVSMSDSQLNKAIEQMGWVSATGGDPMAVLRQLFPELVAAEKAMQLNESLSPIWDAEDKKSDAEREVEDFWSEIDLFDKVTPLEETIKGLDYTIAGLEDAANAWADGNEDLRSEYLQSAWAKYQAGRDLGVDWELDGNYATPGVRDQIVKEVHIYMSGKEVYTADQVDELIHEYAKGTNTKPVVHKDASTVASARRGVMA